MTPKPTAEAAEFVSPARETRNPHPTDELLRLHEFGILSRPNDGPVLWERKERREGERAGEHTWVRRVLTEHAALSLIESEGNA